MNRSIKKIALSLLLAFVAIVLCVLGSSIINGKSVTPAEAASSTVTDIKISADSNQVDPGGTILFTVTITSGFGSDTNWDAISLTISPMDSDGLPSTEANKYFSLDTTYGPADAKTTKGYAAEIVSTNKYGRLNYNYMDNSVYLDPDDRAQKGFLFSVASTDVTKLYSADKSIVLTYRLNVSSTAQNGTLNFGIAKLTANAVQYASASDASNTVMHSADTSAINCNTFSLRIGKASTDADLKTLHVGHTAADTAVTPITTDMTYKTSEASTSFKLKPTVASTSTLKYSVGSGTLKDTTSGTDIAITLDSSGVTTVNFEVTAEDTTTKKNYTFTIKSSYARLSALTATVNRPSSPSLTGVGLQTTFDKDTFTYKVKVPGDYTSVDVKPTILTGYGATGVAVEATSCTSDVTTITDKASITNISDGATLKLTVTAADGETKQDYTIEFDVVDCDVSIDTFTMTESTTGTTVDNDPTKATSNSVQYYFWLSEESGFAGTFNMTLTSSTAKAKVDGVDYSSSTVRTAKKTFNIVVTAEWGNTATYKVMVDKHLKPGTINNLSYSIGADSGNVVSEATFNATTDTYTLTKEYDPATYTPNTEFVLTGTPSEGAVVTATNITGSGPWTKRLALGKNEFTLKANTSGVGATTYKFVISLVEKKNSITSMTIKQGTNVVSDFSFDPSQTSYEFDVPYQNYANVNFEAESDGIYTVVKAEYGGATKTFNHSANSTSHSLANVALTAGASTIIKVYGTSDTNVKGVEYTIKINRADADTNNKLQTLDVSVDGTPITLFDGDISFDPDTLSYTYTIPNTGSTSASIVLGATAQSDKATVTGTGTKTFTFGTTTKTEAYTITVTAESGAKKEYKVNIKRVVVGGDFTDLEVSTDSSNYTSIFSDFDSTHSQTLTYNISDVAVGSTFSVRVALNSTDAKVDSLYNLSKSGDIYSGKLSKFGLNTFKLAAKSNTGSTLYTINVNLYEDKQDIMDMSVSDSSGPLSDFTFSAWQSTYDIDVPFTTSSVTVNVTPDGEYNVICETGNKKLTKNATGYEKTINLTAGKTTSLVVYGVANNATGMSSDPTSTGTKYTLNFTRAEANKDVTLSQLTVKINGVVMDYKDVVSFDPGTNNYVVEIEREGLATTASVELTAVPTVETSKVKCDTVLMTSTSVKKTFTFKNNAESEVTYTFEVIAQSGTDKNTYTVTVKNVIIPGDFTSLEFAEAGSYFEDVFTSPKYDLFEKTYTVDLNTDTVKEGDTVRIKAVPTSGAQVTPTGGLTTSTTNVWLGKLKHGTNEFALTAKSATGEQTYKFVVNLYENKKDIEKVTITADGKTLASDVFSFNKSQTTYRISLPYTVNSIKMTVATDGMYTTVVDELGNAFEKPVANGRNHERTINLEPGNVTTLLIRGHSDKGEDGEWYTFEITRENANSDASLKALTVTVGGKPVAFTEGAFDPERLEYTILVDDSPSYTVNINATPTASTSKATGAGTQPPFNLGDSTATQTYPITVTAEDGTTRTYTITISQKPIVLGTNYDIKRIVINGTKDYYDDVPATYNDPVQITVPYSESRVKVVVSVADVKAQLVINPALTKAGYLDLPEGETVTLQIYAIAEDGTNSDGAESYLFEITRLPKGEVVGDDTEIYIDDEEITSFVLDSDDTILQVLDAYDYSKDKLKFQVDLAYGGTYEIKRITKDGAVTEVEATDTGKFKNVDLDFGTNVFSVDILSSDGHSKKSAIFVVERGEPTLEELSALEIPSLKQDFNRNPYSDEYSYSVASNVDALTLDVLIDRDLFSYDVEGDDKLEFGLNKVLINIYEKSNGRAISDPLRTITLSVYREPSNFWFIMFWIMLALTLVELVIIIIYAVRKNRSNDDDGEPEIYVSPAPAPTEAVPPTPPIIFQLPPQ